MPTRVVEISALEAWIEEVRRTDPRFRTLGSLAKACDISLSAFGRQIKAGSLGVEPALKLALATDAPASVVLQKVGKAELANLIEQCYGVAGAMPSAVREFAALIEPPLPTGVVRTTLQQLAAFRAAWLARSGAHNEPHESPPAGTSKPAKRATRGK